MEKKEFYVNTLKDARDFTDYAQELSTIKDQYIEVKPVMNSLRILARSGDEENFKKLIRTYITFSKVNGIEDDNHILSFIEWLCRKADYRFKQIENFPKMDLRCKIRETQQYFCQFYGPHLGVKKTLSTVLK